MNMRCGGHGSHGHRNGDTQRMTMTGIGTEHRARRPGKQLPLPPQLLKLSLADPADKHTQRTWES